MSKNFKTPYISLIWLSLATIFVPICGTSAFQCVNYLSSVSIPYRNELIQNLNEVVNKDFIPPRSWAAAFAKLSLNDHLISQTDPILDEMGLIVENGGLCGPTCVANIMASAEHYNNRNSLHWVYSAHLFIAELIRNYQEIATSINDIFIPDPRLGTFLNLFLSERNPQILNLGFNARTVSTDYIKTLDFQFKVLNAIVLGEVAFVSKENDPNPSSHAIVILGINTKLNQIAIVDPNKPSEILVTTYQIINKKICFRLDVALYGQGSKNIGILTQALSFTIRK